MPRTFARSGHPRLPGEGAEPVGAPAHGPSGRSNRALGRLLGAPGLRRASADSPQERMADGAADAFLAGRSAHVGHAPAVAGEAVAPAVVREIHAARGGGHPLPRGARAPLQRAFSADLSRVRLHTDERAHRVAASLDAEAATVGQDIFARKGALRPTPRGLHTLAHEVAHAVRAGAGDGQVHCKIWRWGKGYKDPTVKWRHGSEDASAVLDDIGPGKAEDDEWDDVRRTYTPYDKSMRVPDFKNKYFIPDAALRARTSDYEARRADASTILKGCTSLSKLSEKLDAAGYNYSTVPREFLEATTEYVSFKAVKTFGGGDRAALACRMALRDMSDGGKLPVGAAAKYMTAARAREETTSKSSSFVGSYRWESFGYAGSTDFGKWALAGTGKLSTSSKLNCWEAVLYAAKRAGHLSREKVRVKYLESKAISLGTGTASTDLAHRRPEDLDAVEDKMVPIEELLVRGAPKEYLPHDPNTPRPMKGDIIVVNSFGHHVMIAEGNADDPPKVISCWPQYTGDVDRVRSQPITDFKDVGLGETKILMYRPSWG
ncbi:MAG: DUF4157 domain-containing protein [Myxococcales bacterium]|nr:DUF4157 domain-containing protein [Myxococcales bacterium]